WLASESVAVAAYGTINRMPLTGQYGRRSFTISQHTCRSRLVRRSSSAVSFRSGVRGIGRGIPDVRGAVDTVPAPMPMVLSGLSSTAGMEIEEVEGPTSAPESETDSLAERAPEAERSGMAGPESELEMAASRCMDAGASAAAAADA